VNFYVMDAQRKIKAFIIYHLLQQTKYTLRHMIIS